MARNPKVSKALSVRKGPRKGPQKDHAMPSIDLPFLQHRRWGGKDHYRYRRRVPLDLQAALGKTELSISLGKTAAEAIKRYPAVHREAERQLTAKPSTLPETPAELHALAVSLARGLDLDPDHVDIVMDSIASKYPLNEDGH